MAHFFHIFFLFMLSAFPASLQTFNKTPPAPGIHPTKLFRTSKFRRHYSNLWGPQHQNVSKDGSSVTLRIDRYYGSGFRSKKSYMYGYFNVALKLQGGYTAGIITSFYLSNNQVYDGWHDEIDMEFLGTVPGEPIKLQTNVYGNGSGDGSNMQGREQHFTLWFDPTTNFHNYSILWNPHQIVFLVDDIPIRRVPKVKALGIKYPSKPMSVYATIWDASDWATDGGRYRANYSYEPFFSPYTNFIVSGCEKSRCSHSLLDKFIPPKPNKGFRRSLKFVRKNYMVYDYCQDFQRYPNRLPECPLKN